jgi:hypothetical protein
MCISGGLVYSWGWYVQLHFLYIKTITKKHSGIFGRLGHTSVKSEPEPREIKSLSGTPIVNIFCGATSFAVDTRSSLWAWGSAGYPFPPSPSLLPFPPLSIVVMGNLELAVEVRLRVQFQ